MSSPHPRTASRPSTASRPRTAPGPAALRVLSPAPQDPATLRKLRPVAAITATALGAVAALHAAWAAGSTWPYNDPTTLTRSVLGVPEAGDFPPPGLTLVVTGALSVTAVAALARTADSEKLRRTARMLSLPAAAVLAIRGIGGFAQSLLYPQAATPEFTHNDLLTYSPLCLGLAAGLIALEKPTTKKEQ